MYKRQLPLLFFYLFLIFCNNANAQKFTTVKYYDSTWRTVPGQQAFYVSQITKNEEIFICKTYWARSQKLYSIAAQLDTIRDGKKIGLSIGYHENGLTRDSSIYDLRSNALRSYHYYDDGQFQDSITYGGKSIVQSAHHYYRGGALRVHYTFDFNTEKKTVLAFDEEGKPIENYIYERQAEVEGGQGVWSKLLRMNLDINKPLTLNVREGTYQVIVRFVVKKDGSIADIEAETKHGYGMEQEAIRVLKMSPKWIPAIYLNEVVNAYRRQPVTFVYSGE